MLWVAFGKFWGGLLGPFSPCIAILDFFLSKNKTLGLPTGAFLAVFMYLKAS